jgi:hypothetical protein
MKKITSLLKSMKKDDESEIKFLLSKYPTLYDEIKGFCNKNKISIDNSDSNGMSNTKNLFVYCKNTESLISSLKREGDLSSFFKTSKTRFFSLIIKYDEREWESGFIFGGNWKYKETKRYIYNPFKPLYKPEESYSSLYGGYLPYDGGHYNQEEYNKFINKFKKNKDLSFTEDKKKYILLITESELSKISELENLITKHLELLKTEFIKYKKEESESKIKEQYKLKESKINLLLELDKDGNGIVDLIEGKDFNLLLKKHQSKIIEIDSNIIHKLVKISKFLRTKEENIQTIFEEIQTKTEYIEFEDLTKILKNEIHVFQVLLFNSLNMIVSLTENDLITYYEIVENFDKLNIFNSNWENETSNKLKNIEDGIVSLMYSINEMGRNIIDGLGELTYVTEESNRNLSNQLSEIDSSIQVNNFLSVIQTYQMYKINKNTKSLRGEN